MVDGNWLELALPGKNLKVPAAKEDVTPANSSLFALFLEAWPSGVHLHKHWCINHFFLEENSASIHFTSSWDNSPIYFLTTLCFSLFCVPASLSFPRLVASNLKTRSVMSLRDLAISKREKSRKHDRVEFVAEPFTELALFCSLLLHMITYTQKWHCDTLYLGYMRVQVTCFFQNLRAAQYWCESLVKQYFLAIFEPLFNQYIFNTIVHHAPQFRKSTLLLKHFTFFPHILYQSFQPLCFKRSCRSFCSYINQLEY